MYPTVEQVKHMFHIDTDTPEYVLRDWAIDMYSHHPLIRSGQMGVEECWNEGLGRWDGRGYTSGKNMFFKVRVVDYDESILLGDLYYCPWKASLSHIQRANFEFFDLLETCLFLSLNPDLEDLKEFNPARSTQHW